MQIFLGDFSANIGIEGISKPIIGNINLHKINKDDS
jgi:hypothetical protein